MDQHFTDEERSKLKYLIKMLNWGGTGRWTRTLDRMSANELRELTKKMEQRLEEQEANSGTSIEKQKLEPDEEPKKPTHSKSSFEYDTGGGKRIIRSGKPFS